MTPVKLWIIVAILLIGYLIIEFKFDLSQILSNDSNQLIFAIELLSTLMVVLIPGAVLGALITLIPFRKKSVTEKFRITFPLLTSAMLLFFLANSGYLIYLEKVKGIDIRPLKKYEDIQIPLNLNCATVHNGKFETENIIIERNGNKQIHFNKTTGVKREFIVEWISDCEYILTAVDSSSEIISVKITAVNPDNYGCYMISDKYAGKYANFISIKRIK